MKEITRHSVNYRNTYIRLQNKINADWKILKKEPETQKLFDNFLLNFSVNNYIQSITAILVNKTKMFHNFCKNIQDIKERFINRAESGTREYIIKNRAIYESDVIRKKFPLSIRFTIHPKPGQLGILLHKDSVVHPWMGIGLLLKDNTTRIIHEIEVKGNENFIPIYQPGEIYPYYYKEK